MHTWRNLPCHAGNVSLHCSAPWSAQIACLILDCCLEKHNSILLHHCHVTTLTAPDHSLRAGRPTVCQQPGALFLCLTTKTSHRWIIDLTHWYRALIIDQIILTLHAHSFDWHFCWISSSGTWVFVYDFAWLWRIRSWPGSDNIFKAYLLLDLGVTRRWLSPQRENFIPV